MTTTDVTNSDTHLQSRSQAFIAAADWLMLHSPGLSLVNAADPPPGLRDNLDPHREEFRHPRPLPSQVTRGN